MSNEKHLEEILHTAHDSGIVQEILDEVEQRLKINSKQTFQDVCFQVFYEYVRLGKISVNW